MNWTFISWNVNGIRAAEKKGFLDWFGICQADVVALQETKAHPDQLSAALLNIPGYTVHWDWAEKKGYSGTATYSRQPVSRVSRGLGEARFDTEGRTLIHEFPSFVFFNVYFPNGGRGAERVTHKLAFYMRCLEVAQDYMKAGKPVIMTGDFNTAYAEIDLARPKSNVDHSGFMPEERLVLGKYFEAGLIDTFRYLHKDMVKYSWWDMVTRARERNVGWRLDYFLVSPDLRDRIVAADIHDDVLGSDHCPVSLTLAL